jgi:hypothetical protein
MGERFSKMKKLLILVDSPSLSRFGAVLSVHPIVVAREDRKIFAV